MNLSLSFEELIICLWKNGSPPAGACGVPAVSCCARIRILRLLSRLAKVMLDFWRALSLSSITIAFFVSKRSLPFSFGFSYVASLPILRICSRALFLFVKLPKCVENFAMFVSHMYTNILGTQTIGHADQPINLA